MMVVASRVGERYRPLHPVVDLQPGQVGPHAVARDIETAPRA